MHQMTHRFSIKEIAAQAGLGTATVDRVLNNRPHVSARTRARVTAALRELEGQETQLAARGRQVWVDLVVEAPERFSREIKAAAEAAATAVPGAVMRMRFHMHEVMEEAQTVATLTRIAKRGSQGVCLKARDVPRVRQAVQALRVRGIPVVALVTDVAGTDAYAGLNNAQAGRVAAALIAREVRAGVVLTSASRVDFAGEAARLEAFAKHLRLVGPNLRAVTLPPGGGLNPATGAEAGTVLAGLTQVNAVYSSGGGNRAITAALGQRNIQPQIYVAHDLDEDNRRLLGAGQITHVLHHDLQTDLGAALRHVLAVHGLGPAQTSTASDVQIFLRENMPG